jgi:hypothetical protein
MDRFTRIIMRGDAILDLSFGVLTFFSPWAGGLFDLLQLSNPQPAIFTQIAGGLLVAFAYLLWIAPDRPAALAKPVALSVGAINVIAVVLIAGWLISGMLGAGTLGTLILIAAAALLGLFGFGELRYALGAEVGN